MSRGRSTTRSSSEADLHPRYQRLLATFGAFMAVLIAIEILISITMYLRDDVIHVRIVLATAVMAIARKVIIMDYKETGTEYVWATAAVLLAATAGYWLLCKSEPAEAAASFIRPREVNPRIEARAQYGRFQRATQRVTGSAWAAFAVTTISPYLDINLPKP